MSEKPRPHSIPRFATVFFVACFLLIGYFLYLVLRPFFSTLVWASVLTVVFFPLFGLILRYLGGRRSLTAFITCILILMLIVVPITMLAILVTQQSIALYQSVQEDVKGRAGPSLDEIQQKPWVDWLLSNVNRWLGNENVTLREYTQQIFSATSRFLVSKGPSLVRGVGGTLFAFLLMFVTMFFLFRDGPLIVDIVRASNPLPSVYEVEIIRRFQEVSYATFFGSILTALVQGTLAGLMFWILALKAPLFWGALVAFVSLLPIVGAFLVWVPLAGYFFFMGDVTRALILLAVGGLVVSSVDNVLKPMIIQGRTRMHPLLVFLSVLGGLQAFGFLGILLGPLIVAIFLSFLSFYRMEFRDTLQQKMSPKD